MKKLILILLVVLTAFPVMSQTKKEVVSKFEIRSLRLTSEYRKMIDLDKNDTTYKVVVIFQNLKYSSLVDFQMLSFSNQEDLAQFLVDLKKALPEIGNKTALDWNRKNYSLALFEFDNTLHMYDDRHLGYTCLNNKQTEKFISWVETIQMSK